MTKQRRIAIMSSDNSGTEQLAKGRRIAITGSPKYKDQRHFFEVAPTYVQHATEIVVGGVKGLYRWAQDLAAVMQVPVRVIRADWARFGLSAAKLRDREIVQAADLVLVFGRAPEVLAEAQRQGVPVFSFDAPAGDRQAGLPGV